MANNDRVTEAYYGTFASAENQRICQDRIHWMVEQVRGGSVLDIGCSQGIASILAARKGHRVLGVDVEQPSIDFARAELAKEPEEVRERLQFLLSDIFNSDEVSELVGATFDTVLLAEILEHQSDPRRLLKTAIDFLAPGGVLIGAVPFGLHTHHDHKCTFYVTEVLATCAKICRLRSLDIVDGYVRFCAERLDEDTGADESGGGGSSDCKESLPSFEELLASTERVFLEREVRSDKGLRERGARNKRLEARVAKLTESNESLVRKKEALEDKLSSLRAAKRAAGVQGGTASASHSQPGVTADSQPSAKIVETSAKVSGSVLYRGMRAISSTVKLEIRSGRILKSPKTSMKKTYARLGRVLRPRPRS